MEKRKRIFSLFLALMLLLSAVACGQSDPGATENPTDSTEPTQPTQTVVGAASDTELKALEVNLETLQNAVCETAWAYYLKGTQVQYDSAELTWIPKGDGGSQRVSLFAGPEAANSHKAVFLVCSYYAFETYYDALRVDGVPFVLNETEGGDAPHLDATTTKLWFNMAPEATVGRWTSSTQNQTDPEAVAKWPADKTFQMGGTGLKKLREYFTNWEEKLQPGDLIITSQMENTGGHLAIYVGGGMVLECYGGKYNLETGSMYTEKNGGIQCHTVEDYYLNGKAHNGDYELGDVYNIAIFRPLNLLVDENGEVLPNVTLSEQAKMRLCYPGLEIDHTASIAEGMSASVDGTVIYSTRIVNHSAEPGSAYYNWKLVSDPEYGGYTYKALSVVHSVPQGTELVQLPHGAQEVNGKICWTVDMARGSEITLSTEVKVTGPLGDTICGDGCAVGTIALSAPVNKIGGAKLTAEDGEKLTAYRNLLFNDPKANTILSGGTDFAEGVYKQILGIDIELPQIEELWEMIFKLDRVPCTLLWPDNWIPPYMWLYTVSTDEKPLSLVENYYGGRFVHTSTEDRQLELRLEDLEIGDVLIKWDAKVREAVLADYTGYYDSVEDAIASLKGWNIIPTGEIGDNMVLVYVGGGKFVRATETEKGISIQSGGTATMYEDVHSWDFFVLLRPSQMRENIHRYN